MRKLDPKASERLSITIEPEPLRTDAWRGNRSATVIVGAAGDRSLAGQEYRVAYSLPHYGELTVASGKLGKDGRIVLENIAASGGAEEYDGLYVVEVGGLWAGKFRVKDQAGPQEFPLRLAPWRARPRLRGDCTGPRDRQASPSRRLPRPSGIP